jgi:hypothetical protein
MAASTAAASFSAMSGVGVQKACSVPSSFSIRSSAAFASSTAETSLARTEAASATASLFQSWVMSGSSGAVPARWPARCELRQLDYSSFSLPSISVCLR